MAGLLDALDTARRGLSVTQNRIATTGHNIANVDTPGYSRQRAIVQNANPILDAAGHIGTGVEQVSVERIVDRFAQLRFVNETSRLYRLETTVNTFRDVESIVNDQLTGGLNEDVNGFFDALDDLANSSDPSQPIARSQLLSAAGNLISTIHRNDQQLRELQRSTDFGITAVLPEINDLASQIASLNQEIVEAEALAPANDLRDRRDQLLERLSSKVEISVLENNRGEVAVRLGGGIPLVEGNTSGQLVAVVDPANPNPFDPTFSQIYFQGGGSFFDTTVSLSGGQLGGLLEARNQIVGGAVRDLDAIAFSISESVNIVHRAGLGLIDGASHDFFADLSGGTSVDNAARLIGLSADVDPSQGGDPRHIAAGTNPVAGGFGQAAVGDTTHVELLKNLRTQANPTYLAGDTPGSPTGSSVSVANSVINFAANIGIRAQSENRQLEQQQGVVSSLRDRRDAVSGVSLDEEVASLVQLQSSFQANARVISMVNDLMDSLFAAF